MTITTNKLLAALFVGFPLLLTVLLSVLLGPSIITTAPVACPDVQSSYSLRGTVQ